MKKLKAILFDLGGTLATYEGLSHNWSEYYASAFQYAAYALGISIPDQDLLISVEKLNDYNPRIRPREREISPFDIFSSASDHWNCKQINPQKLAESFYSFFRPKFSVFGDSIQALTDLRNEGYRLAVLSDTPTGMPGAMIKEDAKEICPYIDCFLTSDEVGYRKPSIYGAVKASHCLGVRVSDFVVVGDEPKDAQLARNMKVPAIRIRRDSSCSDFETDMTISTLTELSQELNRTS